MRGMGGRPAGSRSIAAALLYGALCTTELVQAQAKRAGEWAVEQIHGPAIPFAVTLEEGTWISVDVSPDGRRIVFDLLGDLYTLPIAGGVATRITDGPAYDIQPRFAPDGMRIVFISDRSGSDNIWTVRVDGTQPLPVTAERAVKFASPAWTPDGQYVVARRRDLVNIAREPEADPSFELHVLHITGGKGYAVVADRTNPAGPAPSPDGRWIYFSSGDFRSGGSVIQRYDRLTGEVAPLTAGYGGAVRPTVSRDGRWLGFGRRIDAEEVLVVRELESGMERVLYGPLDRDEQEYGDDAAAADLLPGFAFTPDGTALILAARGKLRRIDLATGEAAVIPFKARFEQTLTEKVYVQSRVEDGPINIRMIRWAQQTSDGKTLVFGAAGRCYAYDVQSGRTMPIGSGQGLQYLPALSPDEQWIAYVNWSDTVGGHIYKVPIGGGPTTRLTVEPGHYEQPAWSGDGAKLVMLQRFGGDEGTQRPAYYEIRWIDARREGPAHHVTTLRPRGALRQLVRPRFDSAGRRIYFTESPPAEYVPPYTELVSVRTDGTDKRRHIRLKLADEIIPSPDGAWIAFTDQYHIYLAPLPQAGAQPVEVDLQGKQFPKIKLGSEPGAFVNWTHSGKTVTWGWGARFYRVPLQQALQRPDSILPDAINVSLRVTPPLPAGRLLLRDARIVTMSDAGTIERGDLLIERNRIKAIGPSGTLKVPADAKIVDLRGKTIIPGLIDIHAHYPTSAAIELLPERNWVLIAQLAYGVTTLRDPSFRNETAFTLAEMAATGRTLSPRMLSTGTPLWYYETPFSSPVTSLADAREQIRRQKRLGATYVKQYMQPRREQRQWVVEAARAEEIMVTSEGGGATFLDLSMAMDGHTGLEHAIPTAPLYQDVIALLARTGTYYTPTLIVGYNGPTAETYFHESEDVHADQKLRRFTPHAVLDAKARRRDLIPDEEYHFMTIAQSAAALVRAGGKVALGAHGNRPGLGAHWELWALALGGLTPMEVLRAATVVAAEALGLQGDLGSLEAEKIADLVVLDANPLENIRNTALIRYVMKDGVLWAADNMTEVWPETRPLGPFFWEGYQKSVQTLDHPR